MKKFFLTFLIIVAQIYATAQVPNDYEVATWHGFSQCAVTYSFDDLTGNQLPIVIPMFDKYNIKASLNVVTSWVKPEQWALLKRVADNNHEVTSHTVTHPNLAQIDIEKFKTEIIDSKKIIEDKTNHEVITLVYPFCVSNNEDISKEYYISARACDGRVELSTPKNMLYISSKGVGGPYDGFNNHEAFDNWVNEGATKKGWCTFLIHGIDNDGGYAPIKSSELEQHLKYVVGNPIKFWVATFAQVSKYILERNSLCIKEISNKKDIVFTVSCTTDSKVTKWDEPITVSRTIPNNWKKISIKENGKTKIKFRTTQQKLIFDVLPNSSYTIKGR